MQHDLPVKDEGNILNIHQVVFHSFNHFINAARVAKLDHPPGGEAGFDLQEITKIRGAGVQLVDIIVPLGPGADEAHFAFQDVPELRQLIDPPFAHDPSPRGYAIVVVGGKGGASFLGVGVHRAEFVDLELEALIADAFLFIDDGAGGGKAGADGGIQHERGEGDQGRGGEDEIGDALDVLLPFGHQAHMDVRQDGAHDVAGAHGAGEDIERAGDDLDEDIFIAQAFEDGFDFLPFRPVKGDDDQADVMAVYGGFDVLGIPQLREKSGDAVAGLLGIDDVAGILEAGRAKPLFGAVVDPGGQAIAADEQSIKNDLSFFNLTVYPVEDENPSDQGQDEMGGKIDHVGLVEIMIVFYGVVDDDREEDDGAADQTVDKGVGDFGQPGFPVEGIV